MAYQAGRHSASQSGNELRELASSLQQFGGALSDRETIKNKQKEIEIKELEEEEKKKAVEIFEGNQGKDIKKEYEFVTKAGSQAYQGLKANDTINKNYQESLKLGAKNNWSQADSLKHFKSLNDKTLSSKNYNDDFKNAYVNSTLQYESKFKDAVVKEEIGNLNDEFKKENTSSVVNDMKTFSSALKADPNYDGAAHLAHLETMKQKLGDDFNSYAAESINILTAQGEKIPPGYSEYFAELADGDLNVAAAYYKNMQTRNKKEATNLKELEMAADKAVEQGDIKSVNTYYDALILGAGTKSQRDRYKSQKVESNHKISAGIDTANAFEIIFTNPKNEKEAEQNAIIEAELKHVFENGVGLVTKEDTILSAEKQMFRDMDWGSADQVDFEKAKMFRRLSGELPKSLISSFDNVSKSHSFEDMEKGAEIYKHIGDSTYFHDKVGKDGLQNIMAFKNLQGSGFTNEEIMNQLDLKRQNQLNGNTFASLEDRTKREMKGAAFASVLDNFNENLSMTFTSDLSSEELESLDARSGGVISSAIGTALEISHFSGEDVETVTKKMMGADWFNSRFVEYNGKWTYTGADQKGTIFSNQDMIKDTVNYSVLNRIMTGGVDNGIANGQINTTEYDINHDFVTAIENGTYSDRIVLSNTSITEKTGALNVMTVDDNGIEHPITNKVTGEPLKLFINRPEAVAEAKRALKNGQPAGMTLEEVKEIESMTLQKVAEQGQGNKPADLAENVARFQKENEKGHSYASSYGGSNTTKSNGYKYLSKNTQHYENVRRSELAKKDKAETNEMFGKEVVTETNKKIQSMNSKGDNSLEGLTYTEKLAYMSLKEKGIEVDNENDLSLLLQFKLYGNNSKVMNKLNRENFNGEEKVSKHKRNDYKIGYGKSNQEQVTQMLSGIQKRKTGETINYDAKTQDVIFSMFDAFAKMESSYGTNLKNTSSSSASGVFQYVVANGDGDNQFEGSSLHTSLNRLKENFPEFYTDTFEQLLETGMTLEGKNGRMASGKVAPEFEALRDQITNLTHEEQTALLIADLSQFKGSDDLFVSLINSEYGSKEQEQAAWELYTKHHTNPGTLEKTLFKSAFSENFSL